MNLSIIVPAKNEEHYIRACLVSVKQQMQYGDELIVVCDRCIDHTAMVAKRYTKKVLTTHFNNVSKSRNYGAEHAKNEILMFLDADSTVGEHLFSAIRSACGRGYIGGVARTRSLENHWRAHLVWCLGNLGRFFFLTASGMFFCKKDAFKNVGGYDIQKKLAEDTYLILKLKKQGKLCYLWRNYIKTSARRMEQKGYLNTIYHQFKGFFVKKYNAYE